MLFGDDIQRTRTQSLVKPSMSSALSTSLPSKFSGEMWIPSLPLGNTQFWEVIANGDVQGGIYCLPNWPRGKEWVSSLAGLQHMQLCQAKDGGPLTASSWPRFADFGLRYVLLLLRPLNQQSMITVNLNISYLCAFMVVIFDQGLTQSLKIAYQPLMVATREFPLLQVCPRREKNHKAHQLFSGKEGNQYKALQLKK